MRRTAPHLAWANRRAITTSSSCSQSAFRFSLPLAKLRKLHGRLDVVVNNAGYGLIGAIEESSIEGSRNFNRSSTLTSSAPFMWRKQFSTQSAQGPHHQHQFYCWVLRSSRRGFYAAAKFALEGMSLSLRQELASLGIHVTLVEPEALRTDFLDKSSMRYAARQISDFDRTAGEARRKAPELSGKQRDNPDRFATSILRAIEAADPPSRLFLGSRALKRARSRIEQITKELDKWEDLSHNTGFAYSRHVQRGKYATCSIRRNFE
jgi:NAD(P)-dependent dehydrogenase (short-subunit alcohol dehydrogenase family)